MPERDVYHQVVIRALQKDGWEITHDPLTLRLGDARLYVDLGAEKLIEATKQGRYIAVEIKSFKERHSLRSCIRRSGSS